MEIVLASASKRRMELLEAHKINFIPKPAAIEEVIAPNEKVENQVCRLAQEKAFHVRENYPNHTVLGADTVVYYAHQIIGKPASFSDARKILSNLRGNTHEVFTGVCLTNLKLKKTISWFSVTEVTFKKFSDEELEICLATGEPMDKAGAYSLQQNEELLVFNLQGLRSNVIGLPIEEVIGKLEEFSYVNEHRS